MRTDILERKDEILLWIEQGLSKAEIARRLQCNIKTINPMLERLNIQYSGNQGLKGTKKDNKKSWTLLEYLNNSSDIQSNKVRQKLLAEGYKEYKCECCGNTTWMGQPIPLELHHKDGNHYNNTLENYELLCPNCHALTDSYRGKNCSK